MYDSAKARPQMPAELSPETQRFVDELLEENRNLGALAAERNELAQSMARLHADCLELHDVQADLNNQLGRITVAASQLSAATSLAQVVDALEQIAANLIGSEQIAILSVDADRTSSSSPSARVIARAGLADDWRPQDSRDWFAIAHAIESGVSYFPPQPLDDEVSCADDPSVSACVVLLAGKSVVGALTILDLLPQKAELAPRDRSLCQLLETLGGQALQSAMLRSRLATGEQSRTSNATAVEEQSSW